MLTKEQQEIQNALPQFIGTEHYYKLSILHPNYVLTDGTKYLAEKAGAFWLIEDIALYHTFNKLGANNSFVIWMLTVSKDSTALLAAYKDYDSKKDQTTNFKEYGLFDKTIEYTDFKEQTGLEEITFYVQPLDETKKVIFLPSEY